MKLAVKVKEKIARTIGAYFTTEGIKNVFTDANISTDLSLYAKWRITLDAFSKIKDENGILKILEEFCHPLNFVDSQARNNFVKSLNEVLFYESLVIKITDRTAKVMPLAEYEVKETIQELPETTEKTKLPEINKCSYSEKVLDLIAKEFIENVADIDIKREVNSVLDKQSALRAEDTVKEYINPNPLDLFPFYSFTSVLQTIRKKDEDADKTISLIITKLLHPVNYDGEENKAQETATKVEKYLKYDNFYLEFTGEEYLILSEREMKEVHDTSHFEEYEKQTKELDRTTIKEKRKMIEKLRNAHQAYIDVIELFCRDTKKPTKELNDAYIFLSSKIEQIIEELDLKHYTIYFYKPFKSDLYSAEVEWTKNPTSNRLLSWDTIRPDLYKVHSDIIRIHTISEEDTRRTDDEKKLEQINNLISQKRNPASPSQKEILSKKNGDQRISEALDNAIVRGLQNLSFGIPQSNQHVPQKIEITKLPDLNIKNVDEHVITKNKKRVTLPKFPRTEWSQVSILFLDERNILLSNTKDTKPTSFEGLGCKDERTTKPDKNWEFFVTLARNRGQTLPLRKDEREKNKKQKQKITDILRKVFNNDSDPFETHNGGIYKAKFSIKFQEPETTNEVDKRYIDLENVRSEMTQSSQEDIESEFSQ